MADANSLDNQIYTGTWVNHSYGRIAGGTLTLTRENGGLLIAFLALFVAAAGRSFWRLTRFILHTIFSSEERRDGVYHQRQAILRNTQIAMDAGLDLMYSRVAWRGRSRSLDGKLTSVAALAITVATVFVVSGIFSSSVTVGSGSEVLITGTNCGNMTLSWGGTVEEQARQWTEFFSTRTQKASEYLTYAAQCYQNPNPSQSSECRRFARPTLPYSKQEDAACPFDDEMCELQQDNIILDTGYLHSSEHLGLNGGTKFSMRLKRHCAPLVTEGYSRITTNESQPGYRWVEYNYGATFDFVSLRNYSHRIKQRIWEEPQGAEDLYGKSEGDYKVLYPEIQKWFPIASMNNTPAYTSVLFLDSSRILNYAPVTDPWFAATESRSVPSWVGVSVPNMTYYITTAIPTALGCTDIYQLCNPSLPEAKRCWEPTGYSKPSPNKWEDVWQDKYDDAFMNAIDNYFRGVFIGTTLGAESYHQIASLPALTTRFTLNGLLQPATIPQDRWKQEVEYIFTASLAAIQARVVEHARGGLFRGRDLGTNCGQTLQCHRECGTQKIRSPSYYSFSLLGICIILILGALIILLGTFIEWVAEHIAKCIPGLSSSRRFRYAMAEWSANSTLELQRLAHQGVGAGTWRRSRVGVPVTAREEKLGVLEMSSSGDKKGDLVGLRAYKEVGTLARGEFEMGKGGRYMRVQTQDTDIR